MAYNDHKEPSGNIGDKLRFFLGISNPQKNMGPLPGKTRFSIWYFVIALLIFSYMQQYFFSEKVETIAYSQFKQYIAQGTVDKLTLGPDTIKGTLTTEPVQAFTTVRVNDPDLVKELDDRQVNYSGRYDNKFLGSLLSWILPLGIFFLIWRFAMKRMGGQWGSCLSARAKPKYLRKATPKSLLPMWPESMRPGKNSRRWSSF